MSRFYNVFLLALILSFLCFGGIAAALEPSINHIGEVVGSGNVEIKILDRWVSVSDKTYPFGDGASLRSGDGIASFALKDGVRVQMGKRSACEISGGKGAYHIKLNVGSIGFSVPQGISLTILTADAEVRTEAGTGVMRKVSHVTGGNSMGLVYKDKTGTKVTSVGGTLAVADTNGKVVQTAAAGQTVHMASADSQGGGAAVVESTGPSPLIFVGGAAALWGGGYLISGDNDDHSKKHRHSASPSQP